MAISMVDIWNNFVNNGRVRNMKKHDPNEFNYTMNGHELFTYDEIMELPEGHHKKVISDVVINHGMPACKKCFKAGVRDLMKECRPKPSKVDEKELKIALNGHVIYKKEDFQKALNHEEMRIMEHVYHGVKICKDCNDFGMNLLNKICPNKGVGEVQIVKPVFMIHLTDEKVMCVVGDKLGVGSEYITVYENEKINHLFKKDLVKYVVKQ